MDWDKTYSNAKYDLERNYSKYKSAESVDERKGYINNYIRELNHIHKILQGSLPKFFKEPFQNLYNVGKVNLSKMEQNIDVFPKKAMVDGGTPNQKNSKSDDNKLEDDMLQAIVAEKPNVKWDDVAGLHEAKKALYEALIMPIKMPDFFTGNVEPWKGILLYGPPGTGKTFIAKACATECDSTFFSISSSDLMSKYVGESEKHIKNLFKIANEKAPSIIFIDEIDSLCGSRQEGENESSRRVKTEFMVQMQGVGKSNDKVLVLGATNLPWSLDSALRRRFEKRIYIPLPDIEAREHLLKCKLKGLDRQLTKDDYRYIAQHTEGYSGSDLEILCKDVAMEPLRFAQMTNSFKSVNVNGQQKYLPLPPNSHGDKKCTVYELPDNSLVLPELTRQDMMEGLKRAKKSVSQNDLVDYVKWTKEFGVE